MKLLLIDTCGATASLALADLTRPSPILASTTLPGRTASERLVATIRDLSASSNVPLQSLNAIAVVSGPGSFTGVRVGLSAAKGLCEALNIPLITVSRLAVMISTQPAIHAAFAILDAGRGEFYLRISNDQPPTESLVTRDQLTAAINQATHSADTHTLITCEPAVANALADFDPLLIPEPTAEDALPLVAARLEANNFDDIASTDANYLRRTDAEIFAKRAPAPTTGPTLP